VDPSTVAEEFSGPEHAKVFANTVGQEPLRARLWHEFEVHEADLMVEKTAGTTR
jgi:hypothetical protein